MGQIDEFNVEILRNAEIESGVWLLMGNVILPGPFTRGPFGCDGERRVFKTIYGKHLGVYIVLVGFIMNPKMLAWIV